MHGPCRYHAQGSRAVAQHANVHSQRRHAIPRQVARMDDPHPGFADVVTTGGIQKQDRIVASGIYRAGNLGG